MLSRCGPIRQDNCTVITWRVSKPDQCTDTEMTESMTTRCGLSPVLPASLIAHPPAEVSEHDLAWLRERRMYGT